jgi:alkaline phosphatase D
MRAWNSSSRFVIARPPQEQQTRSAPGPNESFHMDAWAGYETARRRLVGSLQGSRVRNPVVITGDIHANYVGDLKVDYKSEGSPVIATELVGTSISSGGDGNDQAPNVVAWLPDNPQIKFHNNQRGYVRCEMDAKTLKADFRVAERVSVENANVFTRATFLVEDGKPGARRAQ